MEKAAKMRLFSVYLVAAFLRIIVRSIKSFR